MSIAVPVVPKTDPVVESTLIENGVRIISREQNDNEFEIEVSDLDTETVFKTLVINDFDDMMEKHFQMVLGFARK